jgi:hypothetical protein
VGSRRGAPTVRAVDPAPARALRALLEQERRRGSGFHAAWRLATMAVLTDLPVSEAESWGEAFRTTQRSWARAYDGLPVARRALFVV